MTAKAFLNPQETVEVSAIATAARPDSLQGMKIGFVDNSKLNADTFINRLRAQIQERLGVEVGTVVRKLAPKDHLSDEEIARLSGCDGVVQCYGDCGTSTSITVADAVRLEEKGIPTASVFSSAFARAAQYQALGRGMPVLPFVEIDHPMHCVSSELVLARADRAVDGIVRTLTSDFDVQARTGAAAFDAQCAQANADDHQFFYEQGWTDGLPVVPPTHEKVAAMIKAGGRDGKDFVAVIPPRMRPASVEKIAVNAVMAGCKPEYFPVVLAAVEAMVDEDADLYGAQTATNLSTPMIIINGPVVQEIQVASGTNALGQGNRANATIGRAIRLVCSNVGGEIPGATDMATHGQPGKFSFCFAEAEAANPWSPYHVERGFEAGESTVTVVAGASSPHNIFTYGCTTGEEILDHFVGALTALGNNNIIFPSGPLLILSPEHAAVLNRDGYCKDDIKKHIFENARIPLSRFAEKTIKGLHHRRSNWFASVGDADHIGVADRPGDVHIVVAGGAGIHSLFIPTSFCVRPVIRKID